MNTVNPINVFNRVLLLVLGALALIVGIITLLLVTQAVRPADVSPSGLLFDQWSGIAALSGGAATTAAIIGTLLALLRLTKPAGIQRDASWWRPSGAPAPRRTYIRGCYELAAKGLLSRACERKHEGVDLLLALIPTDQRDSTAVKTGS